MNVKLEENDRANGMEVSYEECKVLDNVSNQKIPINIMLDIQNL